MRALALGGPLEGNLWKSLAWLAGIFIVFAPLAVRAYKRPLPDRLAARDSRRSHRAGARADPQPYSVAVAVARIFSTFLTRLTIMGSQPARRTDLRVRSR